MTRELMTDLFCAFSMDATGAADVEDLGSEDEGWGGGPD
jgi:hypothetical protein